MMVHSALLKMAATAAALQPGYLALHGMSVHFAFIMANFANLKVAIDSFDIRAPEHRTLSAQYGQSLSAL